MRLTGFIESGTSGTRPGAVGRWMLRLLGLGLVALPSWSVVKATNFGGYDEWLILSLTSRGIISTPYANRPLNLLPSLPAGLLAGPNPHVFLALHLAYLLLGAGLVFALARRLLPSRQRLAWGAAVFYLVWAPSDVGRLNPVHMCQYAGVTFGILGATVLLLASWSRRSWGMLALAAVTAFAMVRAYEGTLALLAIGTPLLLLWHERRRGGALLRWLACYEASVLLAATLVLLGSTRSAYQAEMLGGVRLDPQSILVNLAHQYAFHLSWLFATPWRELAVPHAPLAATLFVTTSLLAAARDDGPGAKRPLLALAGSGLLLEGLGYLPMTLTNTVATPFRMQFLSGPGAALFLAAMVELVVSGLPAPRLRSLAAALLGAWIVAVGTARTLFLQSVWDEMSMFATQTSVLRQLTQLAPDLRPNTLVVLLGGNRAFPATFTFRHALEIVYGPDVRGVVPLASQFLYVTRFDPDAVRVEPWPSIRRAWSDPPTTHGYDEVLAVRLSESGVLAVETRWPGGLPAPPSSSRYAPAARVIAWPPTSSGRWVLAFAR